MWQGSHSTSDSKDWVPASSMGWKLTDTHSVVRASAEIQCIEGSWEFKTSVRSQNSQVGITPHCTFGAGVSHALLAQHHLHMGSASYCFHLQQQVSDIECFGKLTWKKILHTYSDIWSEMQAVLQAAKDDCADWTAGHFTSSQLHSVHWEEQL